MIQKIIKIDSQKPEKELIEKAIQVIKRGGLVAFPTETVYGLGVNALDKEAVRKIFEVKGRPLDNPIIVHIADFSELSKLVKKIPAEAKILAKKFWPGPLTLILLKKKVVPNKVTARGNTVAIRMPKNEIALELIKRVGVPIAAPSANLAGRPSPTTAQHVFEDLGKKVDLIIDGGKTEIGVESTVVDLTISPPQILRPGGISFEELKKIIKDIQYHSNLLGEKFQGKTKSPGMKYRHYAPETPLILVGGYSENRVLRIKELIKKYQKQNKRVGVLASLETKEFYKEANLVLVPGSKKRLKTVAKNLFKIFREFDKKGLDIILAETFPKKEIGFAVMNRLEKASSKYELN
jgi:L-threonylcarbamoyladenylate synthase